MDTDADDVKVTIISFNAATRIIRSVKINPTRRSIWNTSKNQFRDHFDIILSHNLDWGTIVTLKKILKLGFYPKNIIFAYF